MNTLLRAALAGFATGCRSQSALAAYELTSTHSRPRRLAAALGAAGELVGDKLPMTPSRLSPVGLGARLLLGAVTGASLAGRGGTARVPAALIGSGAAAATSFLGVRARAMLAERFGSDLPGAFAEDGVALALAGLAVRRG